ncbi:MAG TPA: hypothetical protein VKH81_14050 [Candidatus Angelobacter sp.]|nr:hypothetical protein [Candidatus Angelobacter sp.]
MPDDAKPNPPAGNPPQPAAAPAPKDQPDAGHIPMGEEMDSAKWTLPPIVPLLVALVLVAVVVAVIVLSNRTNPSASLAITKVASADMQGSTMAAIQVKIDNQIDKPLWVKNITAEIETPDGKTYHDDAAPSMDAARYMAAFPPLQEAKADWLKEELKIPSKTSYNGVAIFSYPVEQKAFDGRKSLTLRIQLYDNPTLVVVNTSPR